MSRSPRPCRPPSMYKRQGVGKAGSVSAILEILCHKGRFWLAAPARKTAMDTPKMALAPNFDLFFVPSSWRIKSSISFCWTASFPLSLGAIILLTFLTAFDTPRPKYLSPPSLNSTASYLPFEVPAGTEARNKPSSVSKSTSTVG